jgi:DNA-binding transcriptional regulator YbjK
MEFISNVERFVELHKNIVAAQKAMKDSKKEKTMLGKQILEYMIAHHMATHEIDGFTVVNKETEVKGKLSLEMIEAMLENLIGDTVTQDYVDKILSALMNQETGDVKNTLVIKKLKEPKEPREKKSKKSKNDDDDN